MSSEMEKLEYDDGHRMNTDAQWAFRNGDRKKVFILAAKRKLNAALALFLCTQQFTIFQLNFVRK